MNQTITLPSYEVKTDTATGWQFVYLYVAVLLGAVVALGLMSTNLPYYQPLAEAFLNGRLDVATLRPDLSPFNGRYYYPDGPLPAILMMPFVALGLITPISLATNLAVFYLCFLLARRFDYSPVNSCWLALAFCFGTSMVAMMVASLAVGQSLTVLCLFLAIAEYEGKRRLPLIGLLLGLAAAAHMPAGLNIMLFGLLVLLGSDTIRTKAAKLAGLGLPFIAVLGLLALYNFARFGSPLEAGYTYQISATGIPFSEFNTPGNIAGPTMALANIPTNLMVFLFGLPEPDGVGASVLLLSPFAFYLVTLRKWDRVNTLIVVNALIVLAVVLSFRSTGFQQVGYRFSLDFLPFIFWLAVRSRIEMSRGLKATIFAATVIDIGLLAYFVSTRLTPPA